MITSNITTSVSHSFPADQTQATSKREAAPKEPALTAPKHNTPEIEAGVPFTISLGAGEAEALAKESYAMISEPERKTQPPRIIGQTNRASEMTVDYMPGPNEAMVLKEYTHELDSRDFDIEEQKDLDPDYNYSEDELEDDSVKNKIGTIAFVIALIAISALLFVLIPHIKNLFS